MGMIEFSCACAVAEHHMMSVGMAFSTYIHT